MASSSSSSSQLCTSATAHMYDALRTSRWRSINRAWKGPFLLAVSNASDAYDRKQCRLRKEKQVAEDVWYVDQGRRGDRLGCRRSSARRTVGHSRMIIIPSDSDTLRKTQSSLDGFSIGGSHTTDAQHCTQQDQSCSEDAAADGPNHSPGCLPQALLPCSTKRFFAQHQSALPCASLFPDRVSVKCLPTDSEHFESCSPSRIGIGRLCDLREVGTSRTRLLSEGPWPSRRVCFRLQMLQEELRVEKSQVGWTRVGWCRGVSRIFGPGTRCRRCACVRRSGQGCRCSWQYLHEISTAANKCVSSSLDQDRDGCALTDPESDGSDDADAAPHYFFTCPLLFDYPFNMGKKLRQKAAKYTPPRNKNAFAFRDDSSNNHTGSNTPKPYFSLRDELQSTEKHEWTKESRLRDQKISFVSAGSMAPLDEPKVDKPVLNKNENNADHDRDLRGSEDAMAQMDINAQPPVAIPSLDGVDELDMDIDETVHIHAHAEITIPAEQPAPQQQPVPSPPAEVEDAPMFFVDTAGDESLAFKGPKSVPAPRAPSPARSSSSDEVVFRGRSGVTIRNDPPAVAQKPASKPASKSSPKSVAQPTTQANPQLEKFLKSLDDPPEWAKEMSEKSKSRDPPIQPAEHWPSMEEANGFADRLDQDLSGVRASRKSKKNRKKQNRIFRLEQDLEDELLRDYIDNIAAEDMPTRARGLGGDSGDDTDEFFDDLLNEEEKDPDDVDVTGLEDEWEDESGSEEEDDDDDTGSEDSSELEERLAREEREAWEDDADIRERRAQAMTDEELALLFMKQEELGINGDDIMLYDDRFGDVDGARAGLANYSFKQPKSGKKKKGGRKSDNFPDATLMADVLEQDAYGGFDVMDFDRPSLRKKNKGRKSGPLPEELGLSDSDLVEELRNQVSPWLRSDSSFRTSWSKKTTRQRHSHQCRRMTGRYFTRLPITSTSSQNIEDRRMERTTLPPRLELRQQRISQEFI
ncbi:hypothetical protein KCU98_g11, partial [Aureobasidium melanogenum]